jgi:hypothetical protein
VNEPRTIPECDRELTEYRRALRLVQELGQVAVWEQIDRILEKRHHLSRLERRRAGGVRQNHS